MARSCPYSTPSPPTPLTALDRCDRCGAPVQVRVVLGSGGELLFCGHHARRHRVRLAEVDAELFPSDTA